MNTKVMRRIKAAGIAFCALCMASVTGCAKKSAQGDTSLDALKKRGEFVLGLDDSFPPMGFRDENGEIVGFDIDLAKEAAGRLSVKFKAQPIDWDAKEMELSTGKIDCIWNGFTITEERKEALEFTEPYLDNNQSLVVKAGSGINSLADMAGRTVGVQSGSSAQEAIEANSEFAASVKEQVMFKDNVTALNDLEIGGIDGVVMDSIVADYSIIATGGPFVVIDEPLAKEAYGIAFRKGDVALRDAVQKTLEDMAKDGTVARISTKWFGHDISVIGK